MTDESQLLLHEEVLLLALRDQKGTIGATWFQQALGGAIAAELLLAGRLQLADSKKRQIVEVVSQESLGNAVLDGALQKIATAKRPATLSHWVTQLGGEGELKHDVARSLCDRGILRADESKVLFFFTRKIYPEIDPQPEREIIERIDRALHGNIEEVTPRTMVLVSLAKSSDLLAMVFPRDTLKRCKERLEALGRGDALGSATTEAVNAAQQAVMVAMVLPAIMTPTITN